MSITPLIRDGVKHAMYHTPLARFLYHRYPYNFSPIQLSYLVNCIDRTSHLSGPILEVGCFAGATTIWLNKHLDAGGIEKPYIAIDTFRGFVENDIRYEVSERGKHEQAILRRAFTNNSKNWVEKNLKLNGCTRVTLVQADANTFDYSKYHDISFALIDVDLYLPVKNTLEAIYDQMADGGIIVVDDCVANGVYDGALHAYLEFTEDRAIAKRIVHRKLGVIDITRKRRCAWIHEPCWENPLCLY
jgi:predicted O-methyltransferase YrrM